MSFMRHADIRKFSRETALLHAATDIASLSGRVTRCLSNLFDADFCSFDLIDSSDGRWNMVSVLPALSDHNAALAALNKHAHEHPIVTHAAQHQSGRAIRTSDLLSLRQYRQTGLFHDLFRVHIGRADRQLGYVARPTSSLALGVSINRRRKDFSSEDCTLLDLLSTHLLQAYTNAQMYERVLERIESEHEAIAVAVDGGICQVDRAGKVEWVAGSARKLLARYFPQTDGGTDKLPIALISSLRLFLDRSRNSEASLSRPRRTWLFTRPEGTLRVCLAAAQRQEHWLLLLEEKPGEPSAAELAQHHGLTDREGEILFWLGQGKTNGEISIILSVRPRTIEKHVEQVFAKLDVDNRTMAARVALGRV